MLGFIRFCSGQGVWGVPVKVTQTTQTVWINGREFVVTVVPSDITTSTLTLEEKHTTVTSPDHSTRMESKDRTNISTDAAQNMVVCRGKVTRPSHSALPPLVGQVRTDGPYVGAELYVT
mgnify:CR=1 FL=1